MMKLLNIELRKILTYKMFWIMSGVYLASMIFVFYGFPSLIDYFSLRSEAQEVKLLKNFIYNYPDIWQNLAWVSSMRFFIKVLLGMIMVVLITNEYAYTTIRSNVMNGLSRTDFLLGKIYLATFLSIISALVILISGIILGLSYSSVVSLEAMTGKLIFLAGYVVEIVTYLLFALMMGLLVKRTGLAIIFLFFYPILEIIIQQKLPESIHPYLPANAMNYVIRTPNTSLIEYSSPDFNIDLQKFIDAGDILVCLAYAGLFILLSYWILKKRDL